MGRARGQASAVNTSASRGRAVAADRFSATFGERRGQAQGSGRFHELGDRETRVRLERLLGLADELTPERCAAVEYDWDNRELAEASRIAHVAMVAAETGGGSVLDAAYKRIEEVLDVNSGKDRPFDAQVALNRAALGIVAWDALVAQHRDKENGAVYALRLLVWYADGLLGSDIEEWLTGTPSPRRVTQKPA